MRRSRVAFAIALSTVCCAVAARAEPPPIGEFTSQFEVTAVSISPTGRYITATVRQGDLRIVVVEANPVDRRPQGDTRDGPGQSLAGNEPEWLFDLGQGHGFAGNAARLHVHERIVAFFQTHTDTGGEPVEAAEEITVQ